MNRFGGIVVHIFDHILPVDDENKIVGSFSQCPVAFLAFPNRLIRLSSAGDILEIAEKLYWPAVITFDKQGPFRNPAVSAIFMEKPVFISYPTGNG